MNKKKGITVLEILIMLTVLGVVGAITYPKFRVMLIESREGYTKASLADLRGAVAIYYSDHYGIFPPDEGTPETRLKSYLVPKYLKEMPKVELPHHYPKKQNTVSDRLDDSGNWLYRTLYGYVGVNSTRTDSKGKPISGW